MKHPKQSIAIYKGKVYNSKHRYQGNVTPEGRRCFEAARKKLAAIEKRPLKRVSDGDVIEYLAREHQRLPAVNWGALLE